MGKGSEEHTGLRGVMPAGTTYQQLSKVFGKPVKKTGKEDFKTDVYWLGTLEEEVFTIYNYKTGHNYLGDGGKDIENLVGGDFHIGGTSKDIAEKVIEYFNANISQERNKENVKDKEKNQVI